MAVGAVATVQVSGIPLTAVAGELFDFFSAVAGPVFACEIATARQGWKSRGVGRVQFDSAAAAEAVLCLADAGRLPEFQRTRLDVARAGDDIVARAGDDRNRVVGATLYAGILSGEGQMEVFGSWSQVRAEVIPEKKKLELFVGDSGEKYKLMVMFGDLLATYRCSLAGAQSNAVLLQLKYAPRIYHGISGPLIKPKFKNDRYHICKEDLQFLWVRTTDFSLNSPIGNSTYLCLGLADGLSDLEILRNLPFLGDLGKLTISVGEVSFASSKLVPMITCPGDHVMAYEILFQLNSLIHLQKICCKQVNADLFRILGGLTIDNSVKILMKMHKLKSTCYDPVQFIQNQLANMRRNKITPSANKSTQMANLMHCYRALVTPTKIFLLGPELETSNYVVMHYSAYASDFLRVSFVEEDWSKLPSDAISMRIEQGLFSKPYRTDIYNRILSILREGIYVGSKRFEFLAFSASQLRANSVWMFASNNNVTAQSIREWMGSFNEIHSVSKCAARMGQLFSSSVQTLDVPHRNCELIEDVNVTTDGKTYNFSDGIGKISLRFAWEVAQKCGLNHIPSAFQIRYGGFKGVVAVAKIFQKLSLRKSMLKFESENTMLCVTKWSEYQPCFLNREIVCLLSTLGIDDEVFESMLQHQLRLLDEMLTNREVALTLLDRMAAAETRTAVKMLMQGYEPNSEPYLSMLLRAYREFQLSDIRSRCRIFVPKGRVLIGCLDESGILDYGQVYVKVTMTKQELREKDQTFFQNVDQTRAVIVGSVVVTKNPCLHPGDIRVLQAVYKCELDNMGFVDCIVFPQKGQRPHPNECSGGDLDGDLYFVCWDEKLTPSDTVPPMDYSAPKPRNMDHVVTLEEIQKFFVDYMINDTLGVIATSHLVHADREPSKAQSPKCLELATLHSMAVDFAKTGAPAEMPRILKLKQYPDFMERWDKPMYISNGILGKLYRAASSQKDRRNPEPIYSETLSQLSYDTTLEVEGFETFLEVAEEYYNQYAEKLSSLMNYYGAEHEVEILTGNLLNRSSYLQKDKKRYGEMKDRILVGIKNLQKEAEGWFKTSCAESEATRMASAWYHVTYHPNYYSKNRFLSFPWILTDTLLIIKASRSHKR